MSSKVVDLRQGLVDLCVACARLQSQCEGLIAENTSLRNKFDLQIGSLPALPSVSCDSLPSELQANRSGTSDLSTKRGSKGKTEEYLDLIEKGEIKADPYVTLEVPRSPVQSQALSLPDLPGSLSLDGGAKSQPVANTKSLSLRGQFTRRSKDQQQSDASEAQCEEDPLPIFADNPSPCYRTCGWVAPCSPVCNEEPRGTATDQVLAVAAGYKTHTCTRMDLGAPWQSSEPVWSREVEGIFTLYTWEQSQRIEHAWRIGRPKVRLNASDARPIPTEIFFTDMIDYDPTTQCQVAVRRETPISILSMCRRSLMEMWFSWNTGTVWRETFEQYNKKRKKPKMHDTVKKTDKKELYHATGMSQSLAKAPFFPALAMTGVFANTVWQWYDLDANSATVWLDADIEFQIMDNMSCVLFTAELLIRFLAFKRKRDCWMDTWFRFDFLLVAIMVVETWFLPLGLVILGKRQSDVGVDNLSVLRMFRLIRLVRIVRLLRASPNLYAMLQGTLMSLRPVLFTVLLLVFILLLFAIVFRTYIKAYPDYDPIEAKYFSSCMDAFWTLLIYGLFMDGIGVLINALKPITPVLTCLFLIFVLLTNFTILNMLIGIICEAILRVKEDQQNVTELYYLELNLMEILACYDRDESHSLGQAELLALLTNPETVSCVMTFGVDIELLKDVLDLQFEDMRKTVENPQLAFSNILATVKRLRGGKEVTITDFTELRCYTSERFDDVQARLEAVCNHFDIVASGVAVLPSAAINESYLGRPSCKETG